jgi:copper chaperone
MKKYQFKTNINCSGCVAKVTPHLNEIKDIENWQVDTIHPGKILTVETEKLDANEVQQLVEKAGFRAEAL